MRTFRLELLGRTGCHLCDEAEPLVQRWGARVGGTVLLRDIDDEPALVDTYGGRVPVLVGPTGRVIAEGRIEPRALVTALLSERIRWLVSSWRPSSDRA